MFRDLIIASASSRYVFLGKGTKNKPFLIRTADDLYLLEEKVRLGDNTYNSSNVYYKITNDITVSNSYGSSIGTSTNPFISHINGDNHTVFNLHESLFGYAGNPISQLLQNSIINIKTSGKISKSSLSNDAGIVREVPANSFLYIENCINDINISNSNSSGSSGKLYGHGGIIGLCSGTVTIEECVNKADISCTSTSSSTRPYSNWGGIIGLVKGTATIIDSENRGSIGKSDNHSNEGYRSGNYGGIVGLSNYATVTLDGCKNSGKVYFPSNSTSYGSGGIIGSSVNSTTNIINSYNEGHVETGPKSGVNIAIGGIIGCAIYGTLDINNCYNSEYGFIEGVLSANNGYFGGILGKASYVTFNIINSYNEGTVVNEASTGSFIGGILGGQEQSSTGNTYNIINCCYNSGVVKGFNGYSYVGGIVGQSVNKYNNSNTCTLSITNSWNIGSVVAGKYVGGIVGTDLYGYKPIANCYNGGLIENGSDIGGIIGHSSANSHIVVNCYSVSDIPNGTNKGCIAGYCIYGGTVSDCYYKLINGGPIDVIGLIGSGGGSPSAIEFTNYGEINGDADALLDNLNIGAGSEYKGWTQDDSASYPYPTIIV